MCNVASFSNVKLGRERCNSNHQGSTERVRETAPISGCEGYVDRHPNGVIAECTARTTATVGEHANGANPNPVNH